MQALILALVVVGLLLTLVFIIYLVDRVNNLDRKASELAAVINKGNKGENLGPYGGLSGKKLWEAMGGNAPSGMEPGQFEDIRERYATVLLKHIDAVFEDGVQAARLGLEGEVRNTRVISTLRGQVESWLPQAQVNAIHQCGKDLVMLPPERLPDVRQVFDEAVKVLYGRAQIPLVEGYPPSLQAALAALAPPAAVTPPAVSGQG